MRVELKPHPDTPSLAVAGIEVEVARPGPSDFVLRYTVIGAIGDIRLPPTAEPVRADELWKHTCFEAFVHAWPRSRYHEYNFSPSTQWAAYGFSGYRSGMAIAERVEAPRIESVVEDDRFVLSASFRHPWVLIGHAVWKLGLSAVIEETGGAKSYWALAHPPGKPDFHHAESFAMALPAAEVR